jgi:hypothetical protein
MRRAPRSSAARCTAVARAVWSVATTGTVLRHAESWRDGDAVSTAVPRRKRGATSTSSMWATTSKRSDQCSFGASSTSQRARPPRGSGRSNVTAATLVRPSSSEPKRRLDSPSSSFRRPRGEVRPSFTSNRSAKSTSRSISTDTVRGSGA